MVVGLLKIVLAIPHATSLKDKRRVVRRVLDRTRAKFNVAAAEVASLDAHRRATLGFAVVSNDARHANSMIDTIASFVGSASDGLVVSRSMKIERREDVGDAIDSGGLDSSLAGDWDDELPGAAGVDPDDEAGR